MDEKSPASEVATTGSDEARPTELAQTGPLRPRGQVIKSKADMGPLTKLAPKHKLLIDYMVNGCPYSYITCTTRPTPTEDDPDAARPLNQNEPLTLEEAADAIGIRRRHARHLFAQPLFQRTLAKELAALRDGAKARALHRIIALVDEPGEGKAADRKVQLQAAQHLLSDGESAKAGVSVTVNNQTNVTNLRAGIVIRARHNTPPSPLEIEAQALERHDQDRDYDHESAGSDD